jgi:hypothetical protein
MPRKETSAAVFRRASLFTRCFPIVVAEGARRDGQPQRIADIIQAIVRSFYVLRVTLKPPSAQHVCTKTDLHAYILKTSRALFRLNTSNRSFDMNEWGRALIYYASTAFPQISRARSCYAKVSRQKHPRETRASARRSGARPAHRMRQWSGRRRVRRYRHEERR